MLKSLISCNATLITLLCENIMYEVMTPEEVLQKFLSHEMRIKDYKHVEDLHQGNVPNTEPRVVALKTTSEKEEGAPNRPLQAQRRGAGHHHQKLSTNLKEPEEKGLQTPQQRGFATIVVKLIIISLNILMIVMIIGKRTRRERKRQRSRSSSTNRREAKPTPARSGTQTRVPPTMTMRTSSPSPPTRTFYSQRQPQVPRAQRKQEEGIPNIFS